MGAETARVTEPRRECASRYAELLGIYREIYPQLRNSYEKLAGFVAQC
jgi:hypothetical protein